MNTSNTMQAVVYENYGAPEVLQLRTVAKPTPKANEILIRVKATTVTAGDWHLRAADPFMARFFTGLFKPKNQILGHELAGVVEAVGNEVTRFKVGDEVFGSVGLNSGTYAEYKCLSEDASIAIKPASISFEEAAAVSVGAITAEYFMQKADMKAGQKVLIYGASGSVGSFAVQLAKYHGANVTAVCSTANVGLVKDLGADAVIDYKQQDVTQSGLRFDLVFDAVGKLPFAQAKQLLKPEGSYITVAWTPDLLWNMLKGSKHKIISGMSKGNPQMMALFKELVEQGKLRPLIDKKYTMHQLPEAHRYVQSGHKKGNVIVQVA